ncbi:MAG: SatD family protein [Bacteroidota bacterium]
MACYYIIMGDVIQSSLSDGETLIKDFKETVHQVNDDNLDNLLSPLTITLGDEFQGVAKSLKKGMGIILNFEETIIRKEKDFKLRYVLNYGDISTPINPKIAYEMLGEGLTDARDILNKLKKNNNRFYIKLNNKNKAKERKLNLLFIIYQSFVDGWNIKDYKLLSEFFEYEDYKIIAGHLQKDKSLIWRRENSLKIKEYNAVKRLIQLLY